MHKEDVEMTKTLPKGHVSCLSNDFRYTPAAHTNVANTFARINRALEVREAPGHGNRKSIERLPVRRPFPVETVESAWRLLRAGGLRPASHPVHLS
jgi:hypothetical protein